MAILAAGVLFMAAWGACRVAPYYRPAEIRYEGPSGSLTNGEFFNLKTAVESVSPDVFSPLPVGNGWRQWLEDFKQAPMAVNSVTIVHDPKTARQLVLVCKEAPSIAWSTTYWVELGPDGRWVARKKGLCRPE